MTHAVSARPALVMLACSALACADAPTEVASERRAHLGASDGSFTTDRAVYVAEAVDGEPAYRRYRFRLVARFTNTTDHPVYLARCYADTPTPVYGVEQLDPIVDSWGSAYNPAWACVGHDMQIEVMPGATREDTFTIIGPNAWDGMTGTPFGTLAGRVRLVYEVQSCRGDGACRITGTIGQSSPFEVRIE